MHDLAVRDLRAVVAEHGLVSRSAALANVRLGVLAALAGTAATAALVWWTLPVLVAAVVVLTAVAASLHQAVHEAWHGNLYRSVRANVVVGTLLVTPLGLNFAQQRLKHHHHHAFVGTSRDPILYRGKPDALVAYLLLVTLAPFLFAISLWLESALLLVGIFTPAYLMTPSLRRACRRNAVLLLGWSVVSWALLLTWPLQVAVLYVLPVLLMGHVLMFMGFPQHDDTAVDAPVLTTVRTVVSRPGFRFVLWNGNYHSEHHVAPNVPFYALPRMHALIRDDLVHVEDTMWGFHRKTLARLSRTPSLTPAEPSQVAPPAASIRDTLSRVSRELRELGC